MLRLLILDIDGVMNDGCKIYNSNHNTIYKRFNDKDFTAIEEFNKQGIKVCFLSSDSWNVGMATKRNISFYNSRSEDGTICKSRFIPILEGIYNVTREEMGYIGDDYYDLDIINALRYYGYTACPSDSPNKVKKSVNQILDAKGGCGVVMNFYERIFNI